MDYTLSLNSHAIERKGKEREGKRPFIRDEVPNVRYFHHLIEIGSHDFNLNAVSQNKTFENQQRNCYSLCR